MKRYSRQHELILNNLKSRLDHPTAEMVYESVRMELPNISLGTVYRNLRGMAKDQEILCFSQNGKEHFDGNISPHIHFCCTVCGRIWDQFFVGDTKHFYEEKSFLVENVIIQGKCSECAADK